MRVWHLHKNFCSNFIHNLPKLETTKMPRQCDIIIQQEEEMSYQTMNYAKET